VAYLRNNGTDVAADGTRTFRGKLLTYDGVHANAAGNEVLADLIAQGIVDALR
jgi:lysophospholipase L1-like esterase